MRIVDANVLLYAVNTDAPQHTSANRWLDHALSGGDTVGLSWIAMLAFVRISTHPAIFAAPLSASEAAAQIDDWVRAPGAVVVHPGPGHIDHLTRLLETAGSAGNITNDAHLAALALEQRADIVSYDYDFARFPGIPWHSPDKLLKRAN